MTLPVFVINLDRRPDRWAMMSDQLDRLGIEAVRIPAVDAQELVDDNRHERYISIGEQACLLSHCKALEAFLRTDAPAALVLEDDAELSNDMPTVLQSTSWWPEDTHLVKLDILKDRARALGPRRGLTPSGNELRRIAMGHVGAAGYLIDRDAAKVVLGAGQSQFMPIDLLLFQLVDSPCARMLKPVQAVPALVRQHHDDRYRCSDIDPYRTKASERTFRKRQKRMSGLWSRRWWKLRVLSQCLVGAVRKVDIRFRA